MPKTSAGLWTWCLEQDQGVLLALLAFCAAVTVYAVHVEADDPGSERLRHTGMIAAALRLGMTA
jgi:hypothetical protein